MQCLNGEDFKQSSNTESCVLRFQFGGNKRRAFGRTASWSTGQHSKDGFFPHGARVRCGCGFPLPQYQTRVLCGRCIVFGGAFRLQLGNLQRRCLCRYVCLRCLFMYPLFHFGLNCQCFCVLSHVSLDIVVLYIWS